MSSADSSLPIVSIMSRDPVTISPRETVRAALEQIELQAVRHLPILANGRLVGMLSDRDLREYRLPLTEELEEPEYADELLDTPIADIMSGYVVSVDTGEDIRAAVDLMLEYGIGAIPVIDRSTEQLVGIVSYVDVLRVARELL